MAKRNAVDVADLFDRDTGVLKASAYSDQAVYDLEMERIFARSWLFLGHESQIPKFGDYITTTMGEDSVILSRQGDGSFAAFLNQCRHRGNRLCLADRGNAKSFRCSYHGWVFNNAGGLVSMPHEANYTIDKSEWGAPRVPRVETYKGLIFGNWRADAPDLLSSLGEATWYLDAFLDANEGGVELIGPQRNISSANWKWQAEQHATDHLHVAVSHFSGFAALAPEGSPPRSYEHILHPGEQGHQFALPKLGHASSGFFKNMNDGDAAMLQQFPPHPAPEYYYGPGRDIMRERLGDIRTDHMGTLVMTVFPNFSLNRAAHYLRVWQPRGPHKTEVWNYVIVDRNMPQEVKDAVVRGCTLAFNASGLLEQDDAENVAMCQRGVSEGYIARQTHLNMALGLGKGGPNPDYPGTINDVYSEEGGRAFYSHWQDMLAGDEA
ncbi:aromatic ring-hydroxylating dioxygenase subunit alpha [Sphingobium aromaticiconvertens]|uniref:aromatic ring-hydroxylating dioxygenase subunit alpha n=1 Tax=Sphingobium aromaticiconvertens TaxID=365341 RepID=UPI003016EFAE